MTHLIPDPRPAAETERWEQQSEVEQATDRIRRMLDQTFGEGGWRTLMRTASVLTPPVDIEEQDDAYLIEVELPGVKRDDVDIELVGNELTISGEFKERERAGILRKRTRRIGRFELRVGLPNRVDPEGIQAQLEHGVLAVRVPKSEAAQRRRIEVSA
jgi:HSP20 family protein